MEKPKRNIWWLITGVCGLSALGWYINTIAPTNFYAIILFLGIIAITLFSFTLFILKNIRRATIITLGVIVWLLLRLFGLRELIYIILLVPILISLEILFQKR